MKKSGQPILLLFILCLSMGKCTHIPPDPCEDFVVSYTSDIEPIISTNCTQSGCHIPGAVIGNIADYDTLKIKINEGVFCAMVFTYELMPPDTPLTEDELILIRCWLENGALEN